MVFAYVSKLRTSKITFDSGFRIKYSTFCQAILRAVEIDGANLQTTSRQTVCRHMFWDFNLHLRYIKQTLRLDIGICNDFCSKHSCTV